MRTLPAVEIDIAVQPGWTWLVDTLALMALAAIAAWWLAAGSAPAEPWRSAWFAVGVLIILLALQARRSNRGRLRWDGRQWLWGPTVRVDDLSLAPGRLGVMLDFQVAMLLRFEPDRHQISTRAVWIAVDQRSLGTRWHELRCAVYARQSVGVSPSADLPLEGRQ